jgi:hypothetical protein
MDILGQLQHKTISFDVVCFVGFTGSSKIDNSRQKRKYTGTHCLRIRCVTPDDAQHALLAKLGQHSEDRFGLALRTLLRRRHSRSSRGYPRETSFPAHVPLFLFALTSIALAPIVK